jgi:hypothetical protein
MALAFIALKVGAAIEARMPIIITAIMSSINVKPLFFISISISHKVAKSMTGRDAIYAAIYVDS